MRGRRPIARLLFEIRTTVSMAFATICARTLTLKRESRVGSAFQLLTTIVPRREWWGSWSERGEQVTLAGVTVLRYDDDDRVVDHRDYWNQIEERVDPYQGW
jgi:hypothetical protein